MDFSEYRLRSLPGGGIELVHTPTDFVLVVASGMTLQTLIVAAIGDQEGEST